MKYWMLTLTCISLLPTSLAFAASDAANAADNVFRQGISFCNQASKLSRTDTVKAREQFSQYQSYLERAKTIDGALFEQDGFAQREATRCALIEDNIARAEAMPIVEASLEQCEQSRNALQANDLKSASDFYHQFEALRDEALQITPTVLRVGSVAVRMRVCDRLVEKISLAQSDNQLAQQQIRLAANSYNKALASCDAGKSIRAGGVSNESLSALEGVLLQLQKHRTSADGIANTVSTGGEGRQLANLRDRTANCQTDMMAAVKSMKYKLDQQVAEAKQAEEAARQATQLAVESTATVLQGQEIVQIGDGSL